MPEKTKTKQVLVLHKTVVYITELNCFFTLPQDRKFEHISYEVQIIYSTFWCLGWRVLTCQYNLFYLKSQPLGWKKGLKFVGQLSSQNLQKTKNLCSAAWDWSTKLGIPKYFSEFLALFLSMPNVRVNNLNLFPIT